MIVTPPPRLGIVSALALGSLSTQYSPSTTVPAMCSRKEPPPQAAACF